MARPTTTRRVALASAALALVLSACGGGPEQGKIAGKAGGTPTPDARLVEVESSNFRFVPDRLRADAGEELALALSSIDSPHDFAVDGLGRVADVAGDETKTERLRIDDPGTYDFYCTIPGHRSAGMEGTLIVR